MVIEQNRHAIENVSRMRELLNEHRKTGLFMLGGRIEILDGMLRTDKGELAAPFVNLLEYRAAPGNVVIACDDCKLSDSELVRQRRAEHGLSDGVMCDYGIDRRFQVRILAEPAPHALVVIIMAGKDDT